MLDYRTGLICALLANIYRKKGKRALQPRDFMPGKDKQKAKQTPEEMLAVVKEIHRRALGEEV